jgi:hypothetical protein
VDGVSHLFHGRQGLTDILPCGNFWCAISVSIRKPVIHRVHVRGVPFEMSRQAPWWCCWCQLL